MATRRMANRTDVPPPSLMRSLLLTSTVREVSVGGTSVQLPLRSSKAVLGSVWEYALPRALQSPVDVPTESAGILYCEIASSRALVRRLRRGFKCELDIRHSPVQSPARPFLDLQWYLQPTDRVSQIGFRGIPARV